MGQTGGKEKQKKEAENKKKMDALPKSYPGFGPDPNYKPPAKPILTKYTKTNLHPDELRPAGKIYEAKISKEISHCQCMVSLIPLSERLWDMFKDSDMFNKPQSGFPSIEFIKAFDLHKGKRSKMMAEMPERLLELSQREQDNQSQYSKLNLDTLIPHILFIVMSTACKVAGLDFKSAQERSLKSCLLSMCNLVQESDEKHSESTDPFERQTETELIVFDGIGADISSIFKEEFVNHSKKESLKRIAAKLNEIPDEQFPSFSEFSNFSKILEPYLFNMVEEKNQEIEPVLGSIRLNIAKSLREKSIDTSLFSPIFQKFFYSDYYVYQCAKNLSFGTITFSKELILPRVKDIKMQVYIEPDIVRDYTLEAFTQLMIAQKVLDGDDAVFKHYTMRTIIESLQRREPDFDLGADFDCIALYEKNNGYYYCLKDDVLFDPSVLLGNQGFLKVCFLKQFNLTETCPKVIFRPSCSLENSKSMNFFVGFNQGDTLMKLYDQIKGTFGNNFVDDDSRLQPAILKSLIFCTTIRLTLSEKKTLNEEAQKVLNSKGWETPISKLLEHFGRKGEKAAGDRQIDLIITIDRTKFKHIFEPHNLRKVVQKRPIYLKAQLTNLWEQVLKVHLASGDEISDEKLQNLLPSYLYVNVAAVARMIDVPYELDFNPLEERIKELGLGISHRYRALGFIAQKDNGEYYNIYVDREQRNQVFCYNSRGETVKCAMHDINPNKLRAVYYERRELDV